MGKKDRYRKPILKDIYGESQHFNRKSKRLTDKFILSGQVNDEFLAILSTLSLEDIIALKMEETFNLYGGKFYGFSIWHSLTDLVKESLFKYVTFCTNSRKEAIMLLGVDSRIYGQLEAKFKPAIEALEGKNNEKSANGIIINPKNRR